MADRYLLESSAIDGYQLEDGSGVYLKEAGQVFTLIAEIGSFSVIGTAAALLSIRRLTAAAGSHVITGTAANLISARRVIATTGSYAWTGTAAILRFGINFTANPGSFSWTGTTASLIATHNALSANSGSFAVTGTIAMARLVIATFPQGEGTSIFIIND